MQSVLVWRHNVSYNHKPGRLYWHHCPPQLVCALASTALAGRAHSRASSHCRPSLCGAAPRRQRQRTRRFERARGVCVGRPHADSIRLSTVDNLMRLASHAVSAEIPTGARRLCWSHCTATDSRTWNVELHLADSGPLPATANALCALCALCALWRP